YKTTVTTRQVTGMIVYVRVEETDVVKQKGPEVHLSLSSIDKMLFYTNWCNPMLRSDDMEMRSGRD
ncbi:hypothetical protein A2U01_0113992, partial [Trifolium medium]|nr:hypothetical protein [Trifolium medium]